MSEIIEWKPDQMLEVKIKEPDDFLKIRETLTRIGVASRKERATYYTNKDDTLLSTSKNFLP